MILHKFILGILTVVSNQEIKSLGDFLNIIEKFCPTNVQCYFRGQSNSTFNISSSFCRKYQPIKDNNPSQKLEGDISTTLLDEFNKKLPLYFEDTKLLLNYNLNDLDKLVYAQHYGLVTRLIDWSKSPLIALYFALEESKAEYSSVYILSGSLNVSEYDSVSFLKKLDDSISWLNTFTSNMLKYYYELSKILNNELVYDGESAFKNLEEAFDCVQSFDRDLVDDDYIFIKDSGAFTHINSLLNKLHEYRIQVITDLYKEANSLDIQYDKIVLNKKNSEIIVDLLSTFLSDWRGYELLNNLLQPIHMNMLSRDLYIINPLPLNPRLRNQQGVLLFSPSLVNPLFNPDDFNNENTVGMASSVVTTPFSGRVLKVNIHKNYAEKIRTELERCGLTKDFVYPELDSVTEVLQDKIFNFYANKNKDNPHEDKKP